MRAVCERTVKGQDEGEETTLVAALTCIKNNPPANPIPSPPGMWSSLLTTKSACLAEGRCLHDAGIRPRVHGTNAAPRGGA